MRFATTFAGLPAALVVPASSPGERRGLLRRLAAEALGLPLDEIEIAHREGRRPRLVRPVGTVLHLSSASRAGLAALAAAQTRVGVDVELVDPGRELPLRVLHPAETAALLTLPTSERARAFARLWACKEAYLKALGRGLSRDPASFRVELGGGEARVRDEERPEISALVTTVWREQAGEVLAGAAVLLSPRSAGI